MLRPTAKTPAHVRPPPQSPSLARPTPRTLAAGARAGLGPAGVCSGFRGRSPSLRTAVACSDGRRGLLAQVLCGADAGPTPPPEPVTAHVSSQRSRLWRATATPRPPLRVWPWPWAAR